MPLSIKSTTSLPPPYDGPATPVLEKQDAARDSKSDLKLVASTSSGSTLCAAGHDTRLGPARMGAVAATMPVSMLFLHCNRTRTCRRCGEKVRRTGFCAFGSEFERTKELK